MDRIALTPNVLAILQARKIFVQRRGASAIKNDWLAFHRSFALEAYSQIFLRPWLPFRMGAFSYSNSTLFPHVKMGRYCSIGPEVSWIGDAHPVNWVTTSPLTFDEAPLPALADFSAENNLVFEREPHQSGMPTLTIGNDVWIGQSAMIMPGITIGHGAIIAAGALVNRDVPPYAIVGGVPAKVIKYRFPEPVVERMLKSEWWLYNPKDFIPLKMADPLAFLDRFEAARSRDLFKPWTLGWLTVQDFTPTTTGDVTDASP